MVGGGMGVAKNSKAQRKIQGSIKLPPMNIWSIGILFWHKKTVMPKKKVFAARNLKDCLPNLPLKTGKAKKKVFFIMEQFYAFLKDY